jgi:hypothetical protein
LSARERFRKARMLLPGCPLVSATFKALPSALGSLMFVGFATTVSCIVVHRLASSSRFAKDIGVELGKGAVVLRGTVGMGVGRAGIGGTQQILITAEIMAGPKTALVMEPRMRTRMTPAIRRIRFVGRDGVGGGVGGRRSVSRVGAGGVTC